jgi:hypothetical protein
MQAIAAMQAIAQRIIVEFVSAATLSPSSEKLSLKGGAVR